MLTYLLNGITVLLAVGALWFLILAQRITFQDSAPTKELSGGDDLLSEAVRAQIASIVDAKIRETFSEFDALTATRSARAHAIGAFWRHYTASVAHADLKSGNLLRLLGVRVTGGGQPIQSLDTQSSVPQRDEVTSELEALIARLSTPQSNPPRSPENRLVTTYPWDGEPGTTRH